MVAELKYLNRILLIVVAVVMLMNCCGCFSEAYVDSAPSDSFSASESTDPSTETSQTTLVDSSVYASKEAYKSNPAEYVVFFQSVEPREVYVSVNDIMEYDTQYPDCNGTWFKAQYTGEDLCIYNAYLYAMENCFIGFELYVEDNDKDFYYIREAFCLDTPFLEQNSNRYGENITAWSTNHIGERVYFRMEQFTEKRWQLKMQALTKCREIVAGIPSECVTQLEKMEYLYSYVCDNVKYVSYENMADQNYLYDAVCKGETVCDGYSNMLNLLFNLIGVECCEAMGSNIEDISQATAEELENYVGHTWVVAEVDGVFYNFDPTYEDGAVGFWEKDLLFFGFSDELITVEYPDCDDTRPKCTDTSWDFNYADLIVENLTDYSNIQKIAEFTDNQVKNGRYVTLIAVKGELSEDVYNSFINRYKDEVTEISHIETSLIMQGNYTIMKITTDPW